MTAGRPRVLAIHLTGAIAIPACLAAGAFELSRALGGNMLSWTYAVEWPLIAAFSVYMWRRLIRERRAEAGDAVSGDGASRGLSDGGTTSGAGPGGPADAVGPDPGLQAWQQYVAQLHAQDPPGGPDR
jgi:hypothetical protein